MSATGTITVPISVTSVSKTSTIFIDVDTYAALYQQVTVTGPNGTKIINAAVGNGENSRIASGQYSVSAVGIYNFTVQIAHGSSKTGPWTASQIYTPVSSNTVAPTLLQYTVASEDQSDNDYNDALVSFRLFSALSA